MNLSSASGSLGCEPTKIMKGAVLLLGGQGAQTQGGNGWKGGSSALGVGVTPCSVCTTGTGFMLQPLGTGTLTAAEGRRQEEKLVSK